MTFSAWGRYAAPLLLMAFLSWPTNMAFVGGNAPMAGTFYASPTGTSGGDGSQGDPWDLQTALDYQVSSPHTIILKEGTYVGKFVSARTAGQIRAYAGAAYAGEHVVLDGFVSTTLVGDIDASTTTLTLADGSVFAPFFGITTDEFCINQEVLKGGNLVGNTISNIAIRGASGTVGGPASHSNGAIVNIVGSVLYITGNNTLYDLTGVEITQTDTRRNEADISELTRGNGIHIIGQGNTIVSGYVHDNSSGCFSSAASANTTWEGVISANNGTYNAVTQAGHGHGFYLENGSGYARIYNCLSLNNFNLGGQGYGVTAPFVGGDFYNSVFANSGAPLGVFDPNKRNYNLIVGPDRVRSLTMSAIRCHFFQPHDLNSPSYQVNFGYGAGVTTATVLDNYLTGGTTLLQISDVSNGLVQNNKVYTRQSIGPTYTISRPHLYNWNGNAYYKSQGLSAFGVTGVGLYDFANWKTQTGYDASGVQTNTDLPDTVWYMTRGYHAGYESIIIYAASDPSSIDIDLSETHLTNGQVFRIYNAFNFAGNFLVEGHYDEGNPIITIDLTGDITQVSTPTGLGYTPPTTVPDFAILTIVAGD